MKSIVLLLLLSTSVVFAQEKSSEPMKLLPGHENGIINLLYTNDDPGIVKIRIMDEKKHLVKSDRIKNIDGFKRPYNLQSLDNGVYTISVIDASGTTTFAVRKVKTLYAIKSTSSNKVQVVVSAKD